LLQFDFENDKRLRMKIEKKKRCEKERYREEKKQIKEEKYIVFNF